VVITSAAVTVLVLSELASNLAVAAMMPSRPHSASRWASRRAADAGSRVRLVDRVHAPGGDAPNAIGSARE
jgi:hypothetical protein